MRTNIDIDDDLMADAMAALGAKTKKATVEEALRRVARDILVKRARALRGTVRWQGDLNEMRDDPAYLHDWNRSTLGDERDLGGLKRMDRLSGEPSDH